MAGCHLHACTATAQTARRQHTRRASHLCCSSAARSWRRNARLSRRGRPSVPRSSDHSQRVRCVTCVRPDASSSSCRRAWRCLGASNDTCDGRARCVRLCLAVMLSRQEQATAGRHAAVQQHGCDFFAAQHSSGMTAAHAGNTAAERAPAGARAPASRCAGSKGGPQRRTATHSQPTRAAAATACAAARPRLPSAAAPRSPVWVCRSRRARSSSVSLSSREAGRWAPPRLRGAVGRRSSSCSSTGRAHGARGAPLPAHLVAAALGLARR